MLFTHEMAAKSGADWLDACGGGYHDVALVIEDYVNSGADDAGIVITITCNPDEVAPNESMAYSDLALTKCDGGYDTTTRSCCPEYVCNWKSYWTDVSCIM